VRSTNTPPINLKHLRAGSRSLIASADVGGGGGSGDGSQQKWTGRKQQQREVSTTERLTA
jgi:hypothetical protein